MIFPEGTSVSERRLRPSKPGRPALRWAPRPDTVSSWACRWCRWPPTTSTPALPLRRALRRGPAHRGGRLRRRYDQDPDGRRRPLTEAIRRALELRLVITRDAADDALVQQVERTFGDHLNPDDDPTRSTTTSSSAAPYFRPWPGSSSTSPSAWPLPACSLTLSGRLCSVTASATMRLTTSAAAPGGLLNLVLGAPVWLYGVIEQLLALHPSFDRGRARYEGGWSLSRPSCWSWVCSLFPLAYTLQPSPCSTGSRTTGGLRPCMSLACPQSGFYALATGSPWRIASAPAAPPVRRRPAVGRNCWQRAAVVARCWRKHGRLI